VSNWEKTMKEWDDSIPDGIKYLSAENRVLTRKVRELESENDALQARAEKAEAMVERLIEFGDDLAGFTMSATGDNGHSITLRKWHALVDRIQKEREE